MSQISLSRRHETSLKKARATAGEVASRIALDYQLESSWAGNTLHFSRPGLTGRLEVTGELVRLEIELGALLGLFKPRIEAQLNAQLDALFPAG